jgi:hypothetical protein
MLSWAESASAVLGREKKRMSLVMHSKALSLLFSEANFEEFCFVFHLYPIEPT